jgi:hypothetical protein
MTEHLIILDVDGCGAAEIVVGGSLEPVTAGDFNKEVGEIMVFKSGNQYPWSSTRKVWNQFSYNVININEDLTVPQFQVNPATSFPGSEQPYNAFLQQMQYRNNDGDPIQLRPQIVWVNDECPTMTLDGENAVFAGSIQNIGDAALQMPIYFAYYADDTTNYAATGLETHSFNIIMMPGDIFPFSDTIKNIRNYLPLNRIWISVNDNAGDHPYQKMCNKIRKCKFVFEPATDIYKEIITCNATELFDVVNQNPQINCDRAEVDIVIMKGSRIGAAVSTNSDNNIVYIPPAAFIGLDTINYAIVCHDTTYIGAIFITLLYPTVSVPADPITTLCEGATVDLTLLVTIFGASDTTYYHTDALSENIIENPKEWQLDNSSVKIIVEASYTTCVDLQEFIINPLPKIPITIQNIDVCTGSIVDLTEYIEIPEEATPLFYHNEPSVLITNPKSYEALANETITVEVSLFGSCITTDTFDITMKPKPVIKKKK